MNYFHIRFLLPGHTNVRAEEDAVREVVGAEARDHARIGARAWCLGLLYWLGLIGYASMVYGGGDQRRGRWVRLGIGRGELVGKAQFVGLATVKPAL